MGNGVRGDWGGWGPTLQGCWKETQGNPEHCWDRPACAAASAVWGRATQHALDLPALLRNPQGWLSSRFPGVHTASFGTAVHGARTRC